MAVAQKVDQSSPKSLANWYPPATYTSNRAKYRCAPTKKCLRYPLLNIIAPRKSSPNLGQVSIGEVPKNSKFHDSRTKMSEISTVKIYAADKVRTCYAPTPLKCQISSMSATRCTRKALHFFTSFTFWGRMGTPSAKVRQSG